MTAIQPDRHGFARQQCRRCFGSGYREYNKDLGHSRCFGCGGTGLVRTAAAKKQHAAWMQAVRAAQAVPVRSLREGDRVLIRSMGDDRRATVVSVTEAFAAPNEPPFASILTRGVRVEYRQQITLTFRTDDGHTHTHSFHDMAATLPQITRPIPSAAEFIKTPTRKKVAQ